MSNMRQDFIGRHLDEWDKLQKIGVKLAHIAHNQRNFYGDGGEEPGDVGLSHAGIAAVAKLNDLGILIDTSHTGQQTSLECAQYSTDPIVSIHTACRDVFDHRHNKYDHVLAAIAEGGGVVGIYTNFLSPDGIGTINDWLDHVDHAVNVMGVEHVAVGTETHTTRGEPTEAVAKIHNEWYQSPIHGVKPGEKFYEAITASMDAETAAKERFRWEDWADTRHRPGEPGIFRRRYREDHQHKLVADLQGRAGQERRPERGSAMTSETAPWAIIGMGMGGKGLAAELGLAGYRMHVHDINEEEIRGIGRNGGIKVEGRDRDFAPIALATADLGEAVRGAQVIIVCTWGTEHGKVARDLAPFLVDGQLILLIQGNAGGALVVRRELELAGCNADVDVAELDGYPYMMTVLAADSVLLAKSKALMQMAALPANAQRRGDGGHQ